MTFIEADKIFRVWSKWCWPNHFILHSIFLNKIPESFLPFPQELLEEALNVMAKQYHENGDLQASQDIQETIPFLWTYTNDKDALNEASETLSNPEMRDVILSYIENYGQDWKDWLERQNK